MKQYSKINNLKLTSTSLSSIEEKKCQNCKLGIMIGI